MPDQRRPDDVRSTLRPAVTLREELAKRESFRLLEVDNEAIAADCPGPEGVVGKAAWQFVAEAMTAPAASMESHVVPGNRVVIGLSGDVPQAAAIIKAISERLVAAGIEPPNITLLQAPPLDGTASPLDAASAGVVAPEFDPTIEPQASCMAADEAGRAIHLARGLVDADGVVSPHSFGPWPPQPV